MTYDVQTVPNIRGKSKGAGSLNTILPYHGEFLVNPVPLELSFNYCSHKCAYCFANLSSPKRKASTVVTNNLLEQFQNRTTLPAVLLQMGFPVCVSNKVDPFAASNHQIAVPTLRRMAELGIPVQIQTRGGVGIEEALSFLEPSVWYISMTMQDDDLRHRIEPGAPTVASRFHLVEKLVKHGHRVVIGLNPLVKEWLPDPTDLIRHAGERGAEGFWIEGLHLNADQIANMTIRERDAITFPLLNRARQRKCSPDDAHFFDDARATVQDMGMEVFSMGQPNRSEFFSPWHALYGRLFPSMQDFVNWCHDQGFQPGDPVRYDQMWDLFEPKLPKGLLPIGQYVGSVARNAWKDHELTNQLTYQYMLEVVWSDPRIKSCPARMPNFAYLCTRERQEIVHQLDTSGIPLMTFNPTGILKYWYNATTGEYF